MQSIDTSKLETSKQIQIKNKLKENLKFRFNQQSRKQLAKTKKKTLKYRVIQQRRKKQKQMKKKVQQMNGETIKELEP